MSEGFDSEMFQRLVLANQYEMMARLEPELADDYRDLADRIRRWWPLESLEPVEWMSEARENPLTSGDQEFVLDVLELFDALQRADGEGRVGGEDRKAVAFPGFCGNHEGKYLGFLDWLRAHKRFRYVRLVDPRDANSHMPTIGLYRRMLDKWLELGRPSDLGEAEAAAIIGERRRLRLDLNARSEPEWTEAVEPE